MSKYKAKPCEIDGIRFASQKEGNRYLELKLLQRGGVIRDLELQPKFELQPSYKRHYRKIQPIYYIADFKYYDNENKRWVIEDVKGYTKDKVYRLKKKMLFYKYPDIHFIET